MIVQSFWIGSLSIIEIMCINSFLLNQYEFHLYTYDPDLLDRFNDPLMVKHLRDNGLKLLPADEILPKSELFQYVNGSYSAFSNLFRLKLLYMQGHTWVDLDVVCIRKYNLDRTEYLFISECNRDYIGNVIGCSILKVPKGSPILLEGINRIYALKPDVLSGKITWGLGPKIISELIQKFRLQLYLKPWWFGNAYCCHHFEVLINQNYRPPINNLNPELVIYSNHLSVLPEDTYFIHLFNEYFRRLGIDKNTLMTKFQSNSLVDQLLIRYYHRD